MTWLWKSLEIGIWSFYMLMMAAGLNKAVENTGSYGPVVFWGAVIGAVLMAVMEGRTELADRRGGW